MQPLQGWGWLSGEGEVGDKDAHEDKVVVDEEGEISESDKDGTDALSARCVKTDAMCLVANRAV